MEVADDIEYNDAVVLIIFLGQIAKGRTLSLKQ